MTLLRTPQPFSTTFSPSIDQYLRIQRNKNLGYKNSTVKKITDCDFSRDPVTQQTLMIFLGFCDQDNLSDGFLCPQKKFCDLYRGRGGRKVRRQAARKAMEKAELEGLLRIVPEKTRGGIVNWLFYTETAIKIIEDSKLYHVGETASNPCAVPCTLQPTEGLYDLSNYSEPIPDQEIFDLLNDVWSPPPGLEKEKKIENSTRLPKAPIAKPKRKSKKSNYKSKFNCSGDAFAAAAELMLNGGHYTFLKGPAGLTVKQDFTRRFGIRLEQWGFLIDPESAIQSGFDLMMSLTRANLSSDQCVATELDRYFNENGIKATKKAKAIIEGVRVEPTPPVEEPEPTRREEPDPEPTEEPQEPIEEEISPIVTEEPEPKIILSDWFSEDEIRILRSQNLRGDSIDWEQLQYFKQYFTDMNRTG